MSVSTNDLLEFKRSGTRFAVLTAYDYYSARWLDQAGVPVILVGDSLAMVVMGHANTLGVTLEEMLHHCRAVARGSQQALLIGDLPFGSYHLGLEQAVASAVAMIKDGGMHAVKMEGGGRVVEYTRVLVDMGIPVIGHLGLTPQFIHRFGGFKVQGRTASDQARLVTWAKELEQAGVFGLVLEAMPSTLARTITASVSIPTVGIGAGPDCDGQVLVFHDVFGLSMGHSPRFIRRYADLGGAIAEGAAAFIEDVRMGRFPSSEHEYRLQTEPVGADPIPQ